MTKMLIQKLNPHNLRTPRNLVITAGPNQQSDRRLFCQEGKNQNSLQQEESYLPPDTTTLAPSFPRTPDSCGFGLLSRPFFLDRKPNIPFGFATLGFIAASAGSVAFLFANSDQEPVSSSTTCTPPLFEAWCVVTRGLWCMAGACCGCEVGGCGWDLGE